MQRVDDYSNVRRTFFKVGSPRQHNSDKVGHVEKKFSGASLGERKQRRRRHMFMSRVMVYVFTYIKRSPMLLRRKVSPVLHLQKVSVKLWQLVVATKVL